MNSRFPTLSRILSSHKQDIKNWIVEMLDGEDIKSFENFEEFYRFLNTTTWYEQADTEEELSVSKELVREVYRELKGN